MSRVQQKPSSRVTVKSIADYAGVSIGSVSSVLNNRHVERRISLETVEKIRAAAAKFGYLPNISARRLRSREGTKNTLTLALITSYEAPITLIKHFIFALREAMKQGSDYSFSVVIDMFDAGHLEQLPGLLTGEHFNAALIMNTVAEDDQFLARTHLPYPVVLVNRAIAGYPSVVEEAASGNRAAEILFRAKRKRLAVLRSKLLTQTTRARADSFMQRGFQLTGHAAEEIIADKLSEEAAYKAVKNYLAKGGTANGLYAVSDALALGAYQAIKESDRAIPAELAVIGVGDYDIAPFFDPPLSCVGVSHQQLAGEATKLLLQQLGKGKNTSTLVKIPVVETLRASSRQS